MLTNRALKNKPDGNICGKRTYQRPNYTTKLYSCFMSLYNTHWVNSFAVFLSILLQCTIVMHRPVCKNSAHCFTRHFVSITVKLFVVSHPKQKQEKKLFHQVEVKLMGCSYNTTDVSKCRQQAAWRTWGLWRWLYMLNDTQQMKGKCDWTAFPRGLNIKASPTGNIVNLPRLPPQWGTHSTMREKWAKCTRPIEG